MGILGTIMDDTERQKLIWYGQVQRMEESAYPSERSTGTENNEA